MNWLLKRLGGAIIAGVGWKLGTDAYEAVKERLKNRKPAEEPESSDSVEEAQAAVVVGDAGVQTPDWRG